MPVYGSKYCLMARRFGWVSPDILYCIEAFINHVGVIEIQVIEIHVF